MILSTSVKNGVLALSNEEKATLAKYIASLEGKSVWLVVSDRKVPRTLSQNAYYWGVVVQMISDETDHEINEVHDELKNRFCPTVIVRDEGREYEDRSTTRLTTKEFKDYIERCVAFAASFHSISIPEPDMAYSL